MSVTLNVCQKVCVQLDNPGGSVPYTWTSTSPSNVSVLTSGSGLSAIIGGLVTGGANVVVTDLNGGVAAVFKITVLSIQNYTTPLTENTVYIAGARPSVANVLGSGTITVSGDFPTFASGFADANVVYFVFSNPTASGNSAVFIVSAFWNRPSATTIAAPFNGFTGTPSAIFAAVIGLAVTSATPSNDTLSYRLPIVQFVTGTQAASVSTTINLPFTLPCANTADYGLFVQNSASVGPTGTYPRISTVLNGNQIKIGWNSTVTSYSVSYAIFYRGIRNLGQNFIVYSDVVTLSITGFTGNSTRTITLATAIATTTLWLVQPNSTSISDVIIYNFRVNGAHQSSTTVLVVSLNSTANLGTVNVNFSIIGFQTLNSTITMTI